jgi:hypothetical protein
MAAKTSVTSVFRPGLFAGKSAIVTGGGSGIGKTITTELMFLGKSQRDRSGIGGKTQRMRKANPI